MVLRWPQESRERLLFLRPSADPLWLEEDVASLGAHHPLIFTLEDIDKRDDPETWTGTERLTEQA
jgi:hypothetical protein